MNPNNTPLSADQSFAPGSMHAIVPAGKYGEAEIVHDQPSQIERIRAAMRGQAIGEGTFTRLIVNGKLWMTDTDYEWRSNLEAVRNMTGDVLIAGLGIGFIVAPILAKASTITVLEKDADVIALVGPHFPSVAVIHADAREWTPPKKAYDAVYLDIWPDIPKSDDWEDIKALKKRYRPSLRKGGWIGAWCEDRARKGY